MHALTSFLVTVLYLSFIPNSLVKSSLAIGSWFLLRWCNFPLQGPLVLHIKGATVHCYRYSCLNFQINQKWRTDNSSWLRIPYQFLVSAEMTANMKTRKDLYGTMNESHLNWSTDKLHTMVLKLVQQLKQNSWHVQLLSKKKNCLILIYRKGMGSCGFRS